MTSVRLVVKQALKRDGGSCCNCGGSAKQAHHVVPLSLGGNDVLSNLVSLCEDCHGLVHDRSFFRHSELTKAGLARAKASGVKLGGLRPNTIRENQKAKDEALRRSEQLRDALAPLVRSGASLRSMAMELHKKGVSTRRGKPLSASTIKLHLQRLNLCAKS